MRAMSLKKTILVFISIYVVVSMAVLSMLLAILASASRKTELQMAMQAQEITARMLTRSLDESVKTAVASFHTTTDALAFKQAAAGEGLRGRLAPIPRQLSAGCGMAWLEPEAAAELLDSLAQRSGIELEQAVVLEL